MKKIFVAGIIILALPLQNLFASPKDNVLLNEKIDIIKERVWEKWETYKKHVLKQIKLYEEKIGTSNIVKKKYSSIPILKLKI